MTSVSSVPENDGGAPVNGGATETHPNRMDSRPAANYVGSKKKRGNGAVKIAAIVLGALAAVLVLIPVQSAMPFWREAKAANLLRDEINRIKRNNPVSFRTSPEEAELKRRYDLHASARTHAYGRIVAASLLSMFAGGAILIAGLIMIKRGGGILAGIGVLMLVCGAAGMSFQEFGWHPLVLYAIVGGAIIAFAMTLRASRRKPMVPSAG